MAGVAPKFSPLDVARALIHLEDRPLSRVEVMELLGLGEGSVRSVLDELKQKGWVASSRQGHTISKAGLKVKTEIMDRIQGPHDVKCGIFSNPFCSGITVRKPKMAPDPVKLRDVALKWGAEAALVLVMKENKLTAPGAEQRIDLKGADQSLRPSEGDIVIIAFADSRSAAETSALAAALRADPWLRKLIAHKFGGDKKGVPLP